jgi:hypothetical protein
MQQTRRYSIDLIIFLTAVIAIVLGCSPYRKLTETNYRCRFTPPGTIQIFDNLYCDEMEISNLAWLEYMFWTYKIFGENSIEYTATFPDESVWEDFTCLYRFAQEYYLRAVWYQNHPLVGITQQQAMDYSKWRSDRVFESLLISLGKIDWDSAQNRENYFSIERYFNGMFNNVVPCEKIKYYPNYRLPTLAERTEILKYSDYSDSIACAYYAKMYNRKYGIDCKSAFPIFRSDIIPCVKDTFNIDKYEAPTVPVLYYWGPFYNLRGNVNEWIAEKNIAVGGSWHDKREDILQTDTVVTLKQNAWTGFRNVCEWKEWGK